MHPFRDGTPVLFPIDTPPTSERSLHFPDIVSGHHLSPRIAVVSRYYLYTVPDFSTSHSSISLTPSSNTPRSSSCFHILPLCEFYVLLLCHKGKSVLLISPPPPDCWYISFFFLADPGPLHEIAVSAFSRSPLGRENTFSFLILS